MKVALVHDALVNRGGAERVLQIFCEIFPDAPIYTSVYLPDRTFPFFKKKTIRTSPLQKIINSEYHLKLLFPLVNYIMQHMKIEPCDVILSSSTYCAKYVSRRGVKHYCYCYTPFRLVWFPESYANDITYAPKVRLLKPIMPFLRKWDYGAAQKIHQFLAMTQETRGRIKNIYHKESIIIPPPIDIPQYYPGTDNGEYFLIVSRLEPYKKVGLVVKTFNELGLPLKVVGSGTLAKELQKMAKKNVEFLGSVSDEDLLNLYQRSIAVIFPQKEDYGIVPLEANACGKPVICYGRGGVETTMVPYSEGNQDKATALFFYEQNNGSLKQAIEHFYKLRFRQEALMANAKRFDKQNFSENIRKTLMS